MDAPSAKNSLSAKDVVDGVPVDSELGCQLLDPFAGPVGGDELSCLVSAEVLLDLLQGPAVP